MSAERAIKAFRPSRMSERDMFDDKQASEKAAKLAQYVQRAQDGLPLFDTKGLKMPASESFPKRR